MRFGKCRWTLLVAPVFLRLPTTLGWRASSPIGEKLLSWRTFEELAEDQEYDREQIQLLGTETDDSGIPGALLAREPSATSRRVV